MTRSSPALLLVLFCMCLPLASARSAQKSTKTKAKTDYALIYISVFGPTDAPIQGVRVLIRKSDAKRPNYEGISDARGEVAQRVPVGPADYLVYADPKAPPFGKHSRIKPAKEVRVHIAKDEREDISLHLTE